MIRSLKTSRRTPLAFHSQLSLIDRSKLDFDRIKICQATMQTYNIFCCLICGKFLAGIHKGSPAEEHCIREDHRLFLDLEEGKVIGLPEGRVVKVQQVEDVEVSIYN